MFIMNFINILGCTLNLLKPISFATLDLILGIGCFLAWVTLTSYIEYANDYSFITRTINRAIPEIGRQLLATAPIFLGFALMGCCLFWDSWRFKSFNNTMFVLFAMMNGDELSNTFIDVMQEHYITGQIYLYVYIFFSISVLINIFLIIIEDTYMEVKAQKKYQWLEEEDDSTEKSSDDEHAKEGKDEGGEGHENIDKPKDDKKKAKNQILKSIIKED